MTVHTDLKKALDKLTEPGEIGKLGKLARQFDHPLPGAARSCDYEAIVEAEGLALSIMEVLGEHEPIFRICDMETDDLYELKRVVEMWRKFSELPPSIQDRLVEACRKESLRSRDHFYGHSEEPPSRST